MKLKKSIILLTIAGVTAAVAIPVSILAANKVKKDNDKKFIDESLNKLEGQGNQGGEASQDGGATTQPTQPKEGGGEASQDGGATTQPTQPKEGETHNGESEGNQDSNTETTIDPENFSGRDSYGYYENIVLDTNPGENEVKNTGDQSVNNLFDKSINTEYWVKSGKEPHRDWILENNTLTIKLPSKKLVSKILVAQGLSRPSDVLANFELEYQSKDGSWVLFNDSKGNNNKIQFFERNDAVLTDKVRIKNKNNTQGWWRIGTFKVGYDEPNTKIDHNLISQRDDEGYYLGLSHNANSYDNTKEVLNADARYNIDNLFDSKADTEYWVRNGRGSAEFHSTVNGNTLTLDLPKEKLINKVFFEQGQTGDTDKLTNFVVEYKNGSGEWQQFSNQKGNSDKSQTFKINKPVLATSVRIRNIDTIQHWWRIGTFKIGYDIPMELTKENAKNKISIRFNKKEITWESKNNISNDNIEFNVEQGFENEIKNVLFKNIEIENNQIFLNYSFNFNDETVDAKYLIATKSDFNTYSDKFEIKSIMSQDNGWGTFRLLAKITDSSITFDNLKKDGNQPDPSLFRSDIIVYSVDKNGSRAAGSNNNIKPFIENRNTNGEFIIQIASWNPLKNHFLHLEYQGKTIKYNIFDAIYNVNKENGDYTVIENAHNKEYVSSASEKDAIANGLYVFPR
ncbi:discoidin domain-containing protein [Mycoplasma sp. CSL10137]|uniref:discoidin domain-containing protein n=1 Tax=Mycoplasma sp. CSL10137 TaxID=2813824 RepID=UPI00197B0FFF|nr:discoidin domain-containing protein [Mycoplasma sp. CSL10137]MBN4083748.1 discoidin domain-containing protein [Mycoplasma sp. CSL10137]